MPMLTAQTAATGAVVANVTATAASDATVVATAGTAASGTRDAIAASVPSDVGAAA